MVEIQAIPHLNALVDGFKILEEQIRSSFRGCHATSPLKVCFFTRKVSWQPLIELHSWAWHILTPTSRAKNLGIICLCSLSGSYTNLLQSKICRVACALNCNRVYMYYTFLRILKFWKYYLKKYFDGKNCFKSNESDLRYFTGFQCK